MADERDSTLSEDDCGTVVENISMKDEEAISPENNNCQKRWKIKYFVIIPIIVVVVSLSIYQNYFTGDDEHYSEGVELGVNMHNLFSKYDTNSDGYLSPQEFQTAYYDIKAGTEAYVGKTNQREEQNYHLNVTQFLENQTFTEDEEVLHLKTWFTPMDLHTMRKSKEEEFEDVAAAFHLHGLTSWLTPNIEYADFAVANFSVFLPTSSVSINPGSTWQIIDKVLAGPVSDSRHLAGYRYMPPHPENPKEELILLLLSMIHKRPFLHMRFPPRGAVACLQAVSDDYYSIMFRLHPEFQLNEPPRYPFWFTPASFIGELVIKKDASHIEFFKMYLPTHIQLNIDMEWITGKADPKNDPPGTEHSGEVDIGFVEEMKIESVHPSRSYNNTGVEKSGNTSITWTNELSKETVLSILEKEFYPFKKVPYLPFNKTFEIAKKEDKLIHHILLFWGSLDDQSC